MAIIHIHFKIYFSEYQNSTPGVLLLQIVSLFRGVLLFLAYTKPFIPLHSVPFQIWPQSQYKRPIEIDTQAILFCVCENITPLPVPTVVYQNSIPRGTKLQTAK